MTDYGGIAMGLNVTTVPADGMSDKDWGFEDDGSGWVWVARGCLVLALPGWMAGASGGWGIWAGAWLVAGGVAGVLALRARAVRSSALARMLGRETATLLNGVGAVGVVGFGIFAFVHGLLS